MPAGRRLGRKKKNVENNRVKQSESKENPAVHYMKTLVEVARESFLILNADLRVISANPTFYQNFQVSPEKTENKFIYKLGNGQWDIPELRRLLEKVLPEKKIVKDYKVTHTFQTIGKKTILLNARQIDSVQLIIIAMEDISTRKELEEKLTEYTNRLEVKVVERTAELAERVKELETLNKTMIGRELKMVELKKEVENLRKMVKNGNGFNKLTTNGKNGNRKNGNSGHKNGWQK